MDVMDGRGLLACACPTFCWHVCACPWFAGMCFPHVLLACVCPWFAGMCLPHVLLACSYVRARGLLACACPTFCWHVRVRAYLACACPRLSAFSGEVRLFALARVYLAKCGCLHLPHIVWRRAIHWKILW